MIQVGSYEFGGDRYDPEGDVLYLTRGEMQSASSTIATPEGHAVRLDEAGEVVGLTIANVRWPLDRDEKVVVTIPQRVEVHRDELESALSG